uniref:E3 ubiquitin-protein ligase n=1 Tax=Oryza glumipatula TaxID=40148 RepID=A0A0D9Y2M2_9ORYZ
MGDRTNFCIVHVQCKHGHPSCKRCLAGLNNKCHICRQPIGDMRCRPLENVLAGMTVPCAFARFGCQEGVRYTERAQRHGHEASCQHAPCHCPFPGCSYAGAAAQLFAHIRGAHAAGSPSAVSSIRCTPVALPRGMPFHVLLREEDSRVFLLLNGGDVPKGRSLSVVCVAAAGEAELYTMAVSGGAPGALSLSASGSVPRVRRWVRYPTGGFLFVLDTYWRASGGSVSVTVHTRSVKKVAKKTEAGLCTDQQQDVEEETTKMTYSIDSDSLELQQQECNKARRAFCKNGHAACGSCCLVMGRECPSCNEPIGDIRCRPLEKVLAAMSAPCKFRASGCTETVGYTERRSHEASCPHAPCPCPFDGCTYLGLLLYNHILDEHATDAVVAMGSLRLRGIVVTVHKSKPFHVVLHRGGTRVFLLLNGGDVLSGRSLSLVSVGPPPPANCELRYKIELAAVGPGQGELALSASGTVPCVRQLDVFEAKAFLFVPEAYWGSSGTVSVTVHI